MNRTAVGGMQSGTVLLVAVGLAAVMATLAVALILRMRSDARESRAVQDLAQCRVMLSAAMAYLQESSRLGWDGVSGTVGATGETFGWTDLRDGALGPRGARPVLSTDTTAQTVSCDPDLANTEPTWWLKLYGDPDPLPPLPLLRYQPYFTSLDESNPGKFPAPVARRWPLPGSVVRCDMPVWQTPPYAIKPIYAANPIRPPVPYGDATWTATWTATNGINPAWLPDIFNANQGALGMLDPQPVRDTWVGFSAPGDAPRPHTRGVAWFRIYRELLSDHDGDDSNDVDYQKLAGVASTGTSCDTVAMYDSSDVTSRPPLRNYSVFIIACGAGPSRGYRFWDLDSNDPRCALEPDKQNAKDSEIFPNEWAFNMARQEDVITWFRVEHTAAALAGRTERQRSTARLLTATNVRYYPFSGPGAVTTVSGFARSGHSDGYGPTAAMAEGRAAMLLNGDDEEVGQTQMMPVLKVDRISQGGGFRWIQRLAKEPLKW